MIRAALALLLLAATASPGLVKVEGTRRINLVCSGSGSPTVVLTAGAGAPASTWRLVQPELAKTTRVCAWDRAGFGRSDASPARQTAIETTRDLDRMLAVAKVRGPLILVGHSIGAYETLLLADRHRARVAGMVLVEPSIPDMFRTTGADPAAVTARTAAPFRACLDALRAGTAPPAGNPVACPPGSDPARFATAVSFFDAVGDSAIAVARPNRRYGAIPLVVLSAGAAPAQPNRMTEGRAALAALSTRGTHRYVAGSSHMMQRDRPDAIVAEVREVMSLSSHTTRD